MEGILNICKPPGISSFSVVHEVRRLTGEHRAGHAGTLDQFASGVLPVALGGARRVIEFLLELPKTYLADIELGVTTDTYDATGCIIQQSDASHICLNDVVEVLKFFQGEIQQRPPVYSALKYHGRRLSDWYRSGVRVEPALRKVNIYRIELLRFIHPRVIIEVECGRGAYVRSLAFDIGEKLGCGAYLRALVRVRYGPFVIDEAISLEELGLATKTGGLQGLLYPIDAALTNIPAIVLDDDYAERVKSGCPVSGGDVDDVALETRLRAYNSEGRLLGILVRGSEGKWWPKKVFNS